MNRGSFLASSASLVALAQSPAGAQQTVPGGTHFVERHADFNLAEFESAVDRPGTTIRQVFEAVGFHPQIFSNLKNSLNGLQFGFGYTANEIALVLAPHGASGAYNYTDEMWAKYRLADAFKLKDQQGNPVTSNIYLKPAHDIDKNADPDTPNSLYQDTSIETLQSRGVVFLTCHTAVEEQARAIVTGGFAPSMKAPQVADDLLTHLIPGTHVVPSMVATIAVLQARHNYTYITLTFA